MKKFNTILLVTVLTISLVSCDNENEDYFNFYDTEYRVGLWISPDKKDTLEFIDNSNLIRKGEFYVYEEYLYRIEKDTLFVKLPDSAHETQHLIMTTDRNSVVLGNMYITTGFADNSGLFLKDNEN